MIIFFIHTALIGTVSFYAQQVFKTFFDLGFIIFTLSYSSTQGIALTTYDFQLHKLHRFKLVI